MTTVPFLPVASSISLRHGDALDHVAELDLAGLFRENRHVVGIPLDEGVALLDRGAVRDGNDRADDDVVALEFAAVLA